MPSVPRIPQLLAALLTLAVVSAATPSEPVERMDPDSQTAHRQLLDKAKAGRIDLYFLGDSITRRWGCTDPQWAALLDNWKRNFHGWNAGNFGWGGDRVEHMLWRVRHGELDGVNPKVIVILAGTNNIGREPCPPEKADAIAAGIGTLVRSCREKAPDAKIILTGIFPRNDSGLDAVPAIRRVNVGIARLADGKDIRYLNLNDRLARPDGTLLEGMAVDRLHLTERAYQLWAEALAPLLTEFLGPKAETDLAPPPTGDPKLERLKP